MSAQSEDLATPERLSVKARRLVLGACGNMKNAQGIAFNKRAKLRHPFILRHTRILRLVATLLFLGCCASSVWQKRGQTILRDFSKVVQACEAIEYMSSSDAMRGFESINDNVDKLLALTDMTYVLAFQNCTTSFKHVRWACARGEYIDSCMADRFSSFVEGHGYATSISHAFIIMHAKLNGYRKISIIEDDVEFSTTLDAQVVTELRANINGPREWSFVRLGYRPYFLEEQYSSSSREHGNSVFFCPTECVCKAIDSTLCHMAESGCDMRSSHFYMINEDEFTHILYNLLDSGNRHRVIDWFVLQGYKNQLYVVDSVATQQQLDIPNELQSGFSSLFKRLCVV